ncbi:hypothetical protein, partial [Methylobacterium sp. BTF04]|uniref:hypothetical protein n=1 Tax=Methylobacterium sp. BTF04 TaxID=2708300 RepID=UPI001952AC0F
MDFDEVTEAFDSELGEGHGSVRVLRIVDPDQPVFGLQIGSDIGEPVWTCFGLVESGLGSAAFL